MVSGSRIDGGKQLYTDRVSKIIQSIREIVGPHSEADIYVALKECNMDPNETAQKLLNQDPFHEVKRRRDKKKENMTHNGFVEQRKQNDNVDREINFRKFSDNNVRRGGYARNSIPGNNREFRVVRDNRGNHNTSREEKPSVLPSRSIGGQVVTKVTGTGTSGAPSNQKQSGARTSNQVSNVSTDSQRKHIRGPQLSHTIRKEVLEEKQSTFSNAVSRMQYVKSNNSEAKSPTSASSHSVIGVYSSSTDPVHVPSPDSRSSSAVGAIRREVGVVGVRRQPSDIPVKDSSSPNDSLSNQHLGRANSSESVRGLSSIQKTDQLSQSSVGESVLPNISVSRSLLGNQHGSRTHQQVGGHQKALQHNKEWKPKSHKKSSVNSPGVIGTPKMDSSPPHDNCKEAESEGAKLHEQLSQMNISENQNVIIAKHIRVPETDRCRLTFGSFGMEFDSSRIPVSALQEVGIADVASKEATTSLSGSSLEISSDAASSSKAVKSLDEQTGNSGSDSPVSVVESEQQLPDKKEALSPQNMDSYADIQLIRDNSPSFAPSETQQQQVHPETQSYPAYDTQAGYDFPYFRPNLDEAVRGQGLQSQEALSSHTANNTPASTLSMMQQQQSHVAQMYPQVHVSHYANLMPYRQFISPVYVPQMAVPGYSGNPTYPHPSNGSSYLLMPGGSSHLNANGMKYGMQQFKPVPAGSPSGYGNFSNPGYAMNASGIVGGATGLEDSSRMKYKDSNLYVPNPQAETSEMWIQNPREHPGVQSGQYYNMGGQTPHAAYLPSHSGHGSFNAAAAQSSHMQFPGLFHPTPQPGAMGNPHHLSPAMGGNVGIAPAAPGPQVGPYQQAQLGHMNWPTNF